MYVDWVCLDLFVVFPKVYELWWEIINLLQRAYKHKYSDYVFNCASTKICQDSQRNGSFFWNNHWERRLYSHLFKLTIPFVNNESSSIVYTTYWRKQKIYQHVLIRNAFNNYISISSTIINGTLVCFIPRLRNALKWQWFYEYMFHLDDGMLHSI